MTAPAEIEKAARAAGLPDSQVAAVVDSYSQAQLDALKNALLAASFFALVSLWFTRRLPGEPLDRPAKEGEAAGVPAPQPA
jgi:hypothetical protein